MLLFHAVWLQFVQEITEGEAREEILSSVNYLFISTSFWSMGRINKLGKELCVCD